MAKSELGENASELSHWRNIVVPQRYTTGCVPTGYEWLFRYLGIEGVELGTFQEDFDLQRIGRGMNSFVPVADSIKLRYPFVDIRIESFGQGFEKVRAIRNLIARDIPCLISLSLQGYRTHEGLTIDRGWHIMPTVFVSDQKMIMIHRGTESGNELLERRTATIIQRHNDLEGGKDISWIEV